MSNSTYYCHFRNIDNNYNVTPKGGVTFGWKFSDNNLIIGFSKCNKFDLYNKKLGREFVNERILFLNPDFTVSFSKEDIINIIEKNKTLVPSVFTNCITKNIKFEITDISNKFIINFLNELFENYGTFRESSTRIKSKLLSLKVVG